jgi:hypothetical protein
MAILTQNNGEKWPLRTYSCFQEIANIVLNIGPSLKRDNNWRLLRDRPNPQK